MDLHIEKTFKKISERARGAGKAGGVSSASTSSAQASPSAGNVANTDARLGRNADRDWQIMAAVFVVIVAAICFWGTNLFYSVNSADTALVATQTSSSVAAGSAANSSAANPSNAAYPLLTQSSLRAVTASFQAQSVVRASLLSGGGAVPDPSL